MLVRKTTVLEDIDVVVWSLQVTLLMFIKYVIRKKVSIVLCLLNHAHCTIVRSSEK